MKALAYALIAAVIVGTGASAQSDTGPPRWSANIVRKQQVILSGVPRPYTAMQDKTPRTNAKLNRGRIIFDQHCSACHGWTGHGSGPEAFALVPAPADLAWLSGTPKRSAQPYAYWAIAEGGANFQSDMPAFKDHLSSRDIWAVIAYIQAGMPRASP